MTARALCALAALVACEAALALPRDPTASAAVPARPLAHYTHQRWSVESDPPRPVAAFAQDHRGYLWIAGATGLFRFDGIRFEMLSAGVDLVAHGSPSAILVRRNGEVWTNFERSRRFAVYRDGRLEFLTAPPAPHRVSAMHETQDGTIWVLTEQMGIPLMRFHKGRWTSFGPEAGAPVDNPFSMVVTSDGTVWVSFAGSVARLTPGGRVFEFVHRHAALGRLSIDPQERIWFTGRRGTYPITGPGGHGKPPPLRHAYATDAAEIRGWPMFDREGNLWIATYYDGLQRVARPDPRGAASPREAVASVERFTARDGLSSNATTQLFQDAEGNIWLGTENGLDRFWPATLRFEPQLASPAAFGDLLLRASDGSIYIGEAATVYRVRPGGRPESILNTRVEPRTLCEAPDGAIWIGTNDQHVVIWRDGRLQHLGQRAPLSYTVYDCAFDAHGDYWITASLGGMARFRNGRWERMFGPAGGAFVPKSMLADAQGRLFVHWNDRTLSLLDGRTNNRFPIPFGEYLPYDVVLHFDAPDTLYVAGRFGLARLRQGRFQTLYARQAPLFSDLKGMIRTPNGDMWFAAPGGIVRMTATQLESAFANPSETLSMELFGAADGLRSRPHSHSRNAIVQGGDGRLWIATQTGTVWLDPAEISHSRTPPRVAVSALWAANRVYRDPATITLPAGTSDIQIDFAMLAFSNPSSARVRYKIEGQDRDWIEAGLRRQAFYTNLRPGKYAFRVTASSHDGGRSTTAAALRFELLPAFYQTRWFVVLCVIAAVVMLWIAYLLRVRQVAMRMQQLHEERLDERIRIAHELHDTLLQGVLSTSMQLQVLAKQVPPDAKPLFGHVMQRMFGVIEEGRQALRGLRASDSHESLEQAFSEMKDELTRDEVGFNGGFRVIVVGDRRPLPSALRDEVYRIGREALVNAFRHAQANNIEVEIEFLGKRLVLRIRDDGRGIDAKVLQSGLDNHFGLPGMRERAEAIGGQLHVISRPGAGTEIEVSVPLAATPHFWRAITISRRPNRRASTE